MTIASSNSTIQPCPDLDALTVVLGRKAMQSFADPNQKYSYSLIRFPFTNFDLLSTCSMSFVGLFVSALTSSHHVTVRMIEVVPKEEYDFPFLLLRCLMSFTFGACFSPILLGSLFVVDVHPRLAMLIIIYLTHCHLCRSHSSPHLSACLIHAFLLVCYIQCAIMYSPIMVVVTYVCYYY